MTRAVILFEDGTAMVEGVEVDALGVVSDLPFLSDSVRVAAVRTALADDDRKAAEAASARGVIAPSDKNTVLVIFVGPPDWSRFGKALWDQSTGQAHAVFSSSVMLVDDAAVVQNSSFWTTMNDTSSEPPRIDVSSEKLAEKAIP